MTKKINDLIHSELDLEKLTLDNSIMSLFALCPRKFLYRKILHLVPQKISPALSFGGAFHEALAIYHAGEDVVNEDGSVSPCRIAALEAFARCALKEQSTLGVKRSDATDQNLKSEYSIEFGLDLFIKYMDAHPQETEVFKVDRDSDGKAMLEVGFCLHLANGDFVGKMDGVIDDGDLLEHKTTSMYITEDFLSQYLVHNQISAYLAALRELRGKTPKKCIVNNIFVKDYKRNDPKKDVKLFKRIVVSRTDSQLDQTLRQIEFRINQIKNFLRVGFDAFYQNAPDACSYKFHTCEYRELCMAQEAELIEMIMEGNYRKEVWEPYDLHGARRVVEVEPRFEV